MDNNDGGPAFPHYSLSSGQSEGLSVRDWFAGQALAGLMMSGATIEMPETLASLAFAHADAMIKARA